MAKDWSGNGKSVFVTLGASNHTDKEREPNDFYATDPIAIDKLIGNIGFIPSVVWECACGTGCLSERLKQYCIGVVSTDAIDRGYGQVQDFLLAKEMQSGCSCIITNQPYKLATEFILHALSLLPDGGRCIMFLKTTFLEGEKRHRLLFSKYPPQRILQFSKRVLCAKNAEFQKMRKVGSAVSYALFVWEKGYKGETTITWI